MCMFQDFIPSPGLLSLLVENFLKFPKLDLHRNEKEPTGVSVKKITPSVQTGPVTVLRKRRMDSATEGTDRSVPREEDLLSLPSSRLRQMICH